jgi:hypothetical protein
MPPQRRLPTSGYRRRRTLHANERPRLVILGFKATAKKFLARFSGNGFAPSTLALWGNRWGNRRRYPAPCYAVIRLICRAFAMPEEGLEPRHADYDGVPGVRASA